MSVRARRKVAVSLAGVVTAMCASAARPETAAAQWSEWVARDRGTAGIPLSMFATFAAPGDLIVYPFFEYYRDSNFEYKPAELGFGDTTDRRGAYRAKEGLIFVAYGISDRWAFEAEAAVIDARLERDPADASGMPAVLEQSGLGDVEGQLRYRWRPESEARGEIFSYFETVLPIQTEKLLIATPDWEFKLGTGYMRTWGFGTLALRAAVAWAESIEPGEYALEYIRGLGDAVRVYAGVEGEEDEVELITEMQLALAPSVVLKLNSAFGVTSKATGWAPEVGLLVRF